MRTITSVSVLWLTVVAVTLSSAVMPSIADDCLPLAAWSEDIKITTDSKFRQARKYTFGFDPEGNIHIAIDEFSPWTNKLTITYMKYDKTWELLVDRLPLTPASLSAWFPDIGVDHLGNAHVVYTDKRSSQKIHYSKIDAAGNIVVDERQLSGGGANNPSINVDRLGQVHVTYDEGFSGVYYTKLDNDGRRLVRPILVSPPGPWEFSKSLVDASGNVYVLVSPGTYINFSTGAWIAKLDARGVVYIYPVRIDNDLGKVKYMTGDIDSNGDIHVVYRWSPIGPPPPGCLQPPCLQRDLWPQGYYSGLDSKRRPPPSGFYYSKLRAGARDFSKIIDNKLMSGCWMPSSKYLDVVCDSTGNVHVVDEGASATQGLSRTVRYCKLDREGNVLETNVALVKPVDVETRPSMNIREIDDTLFVGWTDNRTGRLEQYIKHTVPAPRVIGVRKYSVD